MPKPCSVIGSNVGVISEIMGITKEEEEQSEKMKKQTIKFLEKIL